MIYMLLCHYTRGGLLSARRIRTYALETLHALSFLLLSFIPYFLGNAKTSQPMLHCVTSSGGIARLISRDRQEWGNMYVYVFLHVCDLKILGWETSSAATESQAQVKAHTRWAVDMRRGGGGGSLDLA